MSEAAKKAYLIDAQQLALLMGKNKNDDLTRKMSSVAKSDLNKNEKFYEYSQLYNKYFNEEENKRKPLIVQEQIKNSPKLDEATVQKKLSILPKSYYNKAHVLYDKLNDSPDIDWNDDKVFIRNKQIGNSSIFDFLNLYFSKKKKKTDTPGFKMFKSFADEYVVTSMKDEQQGRGWMRYNF